VLVGISSDSFVITYIHESKEVDGVVAMSMLHQIEIPAGGTLMMKPGGLHVMLMGATGSVLNGDVIPLRLEFANGESLAVDAMVKPRDNQS
jgi:copper(I)-binding protein